MRRILFSTVVIFNVASGSAYAEDDSFVEIMRNRSEALSKQLITMGETILGITGRSACVAGCAEGAIAVGEAALKIRKNREEEYEKAVRELNKVWDR